MDSGHGDALGELKRVPEDFLVREVAMPLIVSSDLATHRYLVLRKCGLSTPAAVSALANCLEISPKEVSYCGRKDEEGITEQIVAIPATVDAGSIMDQTLRVRAEADAWLEVHHHGFGSGPLAIGALIGNSFSITVRGLVEPTAKYLADQGRVNLFFLNYYDTQRFGVPEGPKRTHIVGKALLVGDFATALDEVSGLQSAESEAAQSWAADPAKFFSELDDRSVAFYLAAAESERWNGALMDEVSLAASDALSLNFDSLPYLFLTRAAAPLAVLAAKPELPYVRYEWTNGHAVTREIQRPTVVQSLVAVTAVRPSAGLWDASLDFFLPSGCYATMAVRQLVMFARRFEPNAGHSRLEMA
jgi:tRNA pseudouridine13 synthase